MVEDITPTIDELTKNINHSVEHNRTTQERISDLLVEIKTLRESFILNSEPRLELGKVNKSYVKVKDDFSEYWIVKVTAKLVFIEDRTGTTSTVKLASPLGIELKELYDKHFSEPRKA